MRAQCLSLDLSPPIALDAAGFAAFRAGLEADLPYTGRMPPYALHFHRH